MKLKRIVTMGIAALMAASAMSISAFAKEIVELDDGIIMTVYMHLEKSLKKIYFNHKV